MSKFILILLLPIFLFANDMQAFLNKISYQESRGDYTVVGGTGNKYIGKYQLSNNVLKQIGLGHITVSKFMNNKNIFPPASQEEAMRKLLLLYESFVEYEINKYSQKYFNGIYITKAGILAAVHNVGWPEVKRYFKGKSSKTSLISKRLKQFSEYSIS